MYDYRKLSPEERQLVLQTRRQRGFPLHAPPHFPGVAGVYLITAACYGHRPIFEHPDDLSWMANEFLEQLEIAGFSHPAWVFLPNHYHILLSTTDLRTVSEAIRRLHSRTATIANHRHRARGRKVWYRFSDRLIRSERHYWATVNYIHHNPVKHGYVNRMEEWPWSSIHDYAAAHGEEWLRRTWSAFPVGNYGKGWDW